MSKTSGLFRIGRDTEVRFLPSGEAVANVSLAFNYGKKGEDGNRPTQWIEGALFGQRAETLAPMLLKGSQHVFHLSDVHIETYRKNDGADGVKLTGRIDDVELTDRRDAPQGQQSNQQRQQPQGQQRQQPQGDLGQQRQAPQGNGYAPQGQAPNRQAPQGQPQRQSSGFEDMSGDIPF